MKIFHLIGAVLLSLVMLLVLIAGSNAYRSSQDYILVTQLQDLNEPRTAWLNGTVALSLERSVSQVALALEDPAPGDIVSLIDQQRTLSNARFDTAMAAIANFTALKTRAYFASEATRLRGEIEQLRDEVNDMLAMPRSDRNEARAFALPYELKAAISDLKNLTATLNITNQLTSTDAIAMSSIQDRAWEVREFGGRARTHYAIATLNTVPIPEQLRGEVTVDRKRASAAFGTIENTARASALTDQLQSAISAASSAYFDTYAGILSRLNSEMEGLAENETTAYHISFDDFFAQSNEALAHMSDLSALAGEELAAYWNERMDTARSQLIFSTGILLLVMTGAIVALLYIRRKVTTRLEFLAAGLDAVSNGELDQEIEQSRKDLREVAMLSDSLLNLRAKLKDSEIQSQKTAADQKRQAEVVAVLSDRLEQLSAGHLDIEISEDFGDAYRSLIDDFNKTCKTLRDLVGAVIDRTQNISSGASALSESSDALARRTESQAEALAETSAAVSNITESVESASLAVNQTNQMADEMRTTAAQSEAVVQDAVVAMDKIKDASDQIKKIIDLIEDIAFQTSLLALNAGVEAARAGEAGQGFAVVASEVRVLAQRAADAATEINDLITTSSVNVDGGVALVEKAGQSLSKISTMVVEMGTQVAEIATSAQEQSQRLKEMRSAITQLDKDTQRNAGLAEETNAASHKLTDDGHELKAVTNQFKLSRAPVHGHEEESQSDAA